MRIIIFGATGGIGKYEVRHALDKVMMSWLM